MINRRQIFKMLPLAGVAIPAANVFLKDGTVQPVPESFMHEVKPEKKYLVRIAHPISSDVLDCIRRAFAEHGLENVKVFAGNFEIYELEG
jgi:hypothetical protein